MRGVLVLWTMHDASPVTLHCAETRHCRTHVGHPRHLPGTGSGPLPARGASSRARSSRALIIATCSLPPDVEILSIWSTWSCLSGPTEPVLRPGEGGRAVSPVRLCPAARRWHPSHAHIRPRPPRPPTTAIGHPSCRPCGGISWHPAMAPCPGPRRGVVGEPAASPACVRRGRPCSGPVPPRAVSDLRRPHAHPFHIRTS